MGQSLLGASLVSKMKFTPEQLARVQVILKEMRQLHGISESEYLLAEGIIGMLDTVLTGMSPELKVKLLRFVVSTHEMIAKEVGLIK